MLAKKRRLDTRLFDKVMKESGFLHLPHLTLRYVRNNGLKDNRFAVVVSKKIAKKAVERNRLRRRMFGVLKDSKISNDKAAVIIFLKKGVDLMSYSDLKKEVAEGLKKMLQ